MIQTELKPVTVYRSTDNGAPQLTNAAGSLKTVLKACLIEGYGSQPSLGWEMPFEDNTTAVFKGKDPKSPNAALQVKNAAKFVADVAMMIEPTGLDAARKIAFQQSRRLQYLTNGKQSSKWILIGHNRAFVLLFEGYYSRSRFLWFGDFPTLAAGDTGNCALAYASDGNQNYLSSGGSSRALFLLGVSGGQSRVIFAKSATGLNLGPTEGAVSSLCAPFFGLPFPDSITNGLSISECYLHEYDINRYPMRGLLPGIYVCANNLQTFEEWQEMGDFIGSTDRFINCCLEDTHNAIYNYYLINTTAWRA